MEEAKILGIKFHTSYALNAWCKDTTDSFPSNKWHFSVGYIYAFEILILSSADIFYRQKWSKHAKSGT